MTTYAQIHSQWQNTVTAIRREVWLKQHNCSLLAQTVLAVDDGKLYEDILRGRACPKMAVRVIASARNVLHRTHIRRLLEAVKEVVDQYR